MTELTQRQKQGKMLSFGLAAAACLIIVVQTFALHKPPRLASSAVISGILCSTAAPLVPRLRKVLIGLSLALLALAVYAAMKT